MGKNASEMGQITPIARDHRSALTHRIVPRCQLLAKDRHAGQLVLHRLTDGGDHISQGDPGLEMDLHRDHRWLVDGGSDATAEPDHHLLQGRDLSVECVGELLGEYTVDLPHMADRILASSRL